MPRITYLFIVFLFQVPLWAQQMPLQIPLNSSTVFKDTEGKTISFEDFLEQTSGRDYEMNPVFDENNELKEVIVVRASFAAPKNSPSPGQFTNTVELIDRIPPNFEGTDIRGNYYNTENLAGKILVLKFWFKACKPCIDEIPELNQLVANYQDNPEVVFLAPSLDSESTVKSFLQRMPFAYNILPDARNIAHDYNVPGYPTHVVINRFGQVNTVYLGINYKIKDKLTKAIDFALSQTSPAPPKELALEAQPKEEIPRPEEEIIINPNSIIRNEAKELVPFGEFVELMNSGEFELSAQKDDTGESYILMTPVKR